LAPGPESEARPVNLPDLEAKKQRAKKLWDEAKANLESAEKNDIEDEGERETLLEEAKDKLSKAREDFSLASKAIGKAKIHVSDGNSFFQPTTKKTKESAAHVQKN
jgi:hypothetical protein